MFSGRTTYLILNIRNSHIYKYIEPYVTFEDALKSSWAYFKNFSEKMYNDRNFILFILICYI